MLAYYQSFTQWSTWGGEVVALPLQLQKARPAVEITSGSKLY